MSVKLIPPIVLDTVMKFNKRNALLYLKSNCVKDTLIKPYFEPYTKLLISLAEAKVHTFGRRERSLLLEDITYESLELLEEYLNKLEDCPVLRNIFFHLHIEYCHYLDQKYQKQLQVNTSVIKNLESDFSNLNVSLQHETDDFLYNYFIKMKEDISFNEL